MQSSKQRCILNARHALIQTKSMIRLRQQRTTRRKSIGSPGFFLKKRLMILCLCAWLLWCSTLCCASSELVAPSNIIMFPFHVVLPSWEDSTAGGGGASWHAEGSFVEDSRNVAADGEEPGTLLRIRSTLPLHLPRRHHDRDDVLHPRGTHVVDRVFALSLSYERTSHKESAKHPCTSGPLMSSINAAQLEREGADMWSWDIPMVGTEETTGSVENHGNDRGMEFSSISMNPGRYFLCAGVESVGGDVAEVARRLVPVAYFDVFGWWAEHNMPENADLAPLHGWFPSILWGSQRNEEGNQLGAASLIWKQEGLVDRSTYTDEDIVFPVESMDSRSNSLLGGRRVTLMHAIGLPSESIGDACVPVAIQVATSLIMDDTDEVESARQGEDMAYRAPTTMVVHVSLKDGAMRQPKKDALGMGVVSLQTFESSSCALTKMARGPTTLSIDDHDDGSQDPQTHDPSWSHADAASTVELPGDEGNVSLRIVPLPSVTTPTDVLSESEVDSSSSSWGLETSIRLHGATEALQLQGCAIHDNSGQIPCTIPHHDGARDASPVVCPLTRAMLWVLLFPFSVPNAASTDRWGRRTLVDFTLHCLPRGPPFHPIVVNPRSAVLHDVAVSCEGRSAALVLVDASSWFPDIVVVRYLVSASPSEVFFLKTSGQETQEEQKGSRGIMEALPSRLEASTTLPSGHSIHQVNVLDGWRRSRPPACGGSSPACGSSSLHIKRRDGENIQWCNVSLGATTRHTTAEGDRGGQWGALLPELQLHTEGDDARASTTVLLAGNVRQRLPPRSAHAELLRSYLIRSPVMPDEDEATPPPTLRAHLVATRPSDAVRRMSHVVNNDANKCLPANSAESDRPVLYAWDVWCGPDRHEDWAAPLVVTPREQASNDNDNSNFSTDQRMLSWHVVGTPAIIPADVVRNVSTTATESMRRDEDDGMLRLFAVFCMRRDDPATADRRRGQLLVVPVVLLNSFHVSPTTASLQTVCPLVGAQRQEAHFKLSSAPPPPSCLDMFPKAKLVRQPTRPGFQGGTATLPGDIIGSYYCDENDSAGPSKRAAAAHHVPLDITDGVALANYTLLFGDDAGLLRPTLSAHPDRALLFRANRPQLFEAAAGGSGTATGIAHRRLGPFATCVTVNVTAWWLRSGGAAYQGRDEELYTVFVGFANFVAPPMVQAVAVPPPSALTVDALSESWWAFVVTNLDALQQSLSAIPSSQATPVNDSVAALRAQWARLPLRLVPFPRSISSRDYMRRYKPHRLCVPTVSSGNGAPPILRHAMPLAPADAADVANAARDMYRTTRIDGSVVWLLRVRGSFYGEHAVCANMDGVDEFVGVLSVPGPWYVSLSLPSPQVVRMRSPAPQHQQIVEVIAGSVVKLAFSVVAHSGAEFLRSSLQLLRLEDDRWAAMIGAEEPHPDVHRTEGNLDIGSPLQYEEITRPSVSQDVDRVVTAVLTPTVPGDYLVCFAKGLAWDNTSKLASGQQRSPQGIALSTVVRSIMARSIRWSRRFDLEDRLSAEGRDHSLASDAHFYSVPLSPIQHSVGLAPILGLNRTATVRLPTLSDLSTWTIVTVRPPKIETPHRHIAVEMEGSRLVMHLLSSDVVMRLASHVVGWATACVESPFSTTITEAYPASHHPPQHSDGDDAHPQVDTLGHHKGVSVARSAVFLKDGGVRLSFILAGRNLCGRRSLQLLAGWRRVSRAVRTQHRNRHVQQTDPNVSDDSVVDAHRVVWRSVVSSLALPATVLDKVHQHRDAAEKYNEPTTAHSEEEPTSDDTPEEANVDALDLSDSLDDL